MVVFIKLLLEGYVFSQVIAGIVCGVTVIVIIYWALTKTIKMAMIEDGELDLTFEHQYKLHWWNFYKHPLTAKAKSKLNVVDTQQCSRGLMEGSKESLLRVSTRL